MSVLTPGKFPGWDFIVALACLLPVFAISQEPVRRQNRKLTLDDFKGPADERSGFLARTYTVISMRYSSPFPCTSDRTKVQVKVETSNRVSEKSWMRAERIKNKSLLADLLSHEQGHADIGEAFAIELKERISSTCFDAQRYKVQADSILRAMNKRYDALQMQYDTETSNMMNREMQLRWKKKIEAMLISR
jgi:predicted secreted Zn-dependent protease